MGREQPGTTVDDGGSAWMLSTPAENATARRGVIYELFVLGELMGGPHHGYLLREILGRILGPFQQLSWGALYPLIRRLEQDHLIAPVPTPAVSNHGVSRGRGRQRILYAITPTGRTRFYAVLLEASPHTADYPDLFIVKLNYFGHITPAQRLDVLGHYHDYLDVEEDYLRRGRQQLVSNSRMLDADRAHILRVVHYRSSDVADRLAWVDAEMAQVAGEVGQ